MSGDLLEQLLTVSSYTVAVAVRPDRSVESANPLFADLVGVAQGDLSGRPLSEFLTAADAERVGRWLNDGPPSEPSALNLVTPDGSPRTFWCFADRTGSGLCLIGEPDQAGDGAAAEELMKLNNELATMAREQVRRQRELERTRQELEEALEELRTAYWHIRKIQEVLPVCMECGKVKSDESGWESVADYLWENEILVSHGYCPGCAAAVMRKHGLDTEDEE